MMEELFDPFAFLDGNPITPIVGTDGEDLFELEFDPLEDTANDFSLVIDMLKENDFLAFTYFSNQPEQGVIVQLGQGDDDIQSLYSDFGTMLYVDAGMGDDDLVISGYATVVGSNPEAPEEPLLVIVPSTATQFYLFGNEGMDTFDLDYLEATNVTVLGGDGVDTVYMDYVRATEVIVEGGADKDYITLDNITISGSFELGLINVAGGDGDDKIRIDNVTYEDQDGGGARAVRIEVLHEYGINIRGEDGDDDISGSNLGDTIEGGLGSDMIDAGEGIDFVYGGEKVIQQKALLVDVDPPIILPDNDIINGGADGDVIFGGLGTNTIYGDGEGLRGDEVDEDGNPLLVQGADSIRGGDLDDIIFGNGGADSIMGEDGADWLQGNQGADVVDGGLGDDRLVAGGNDNDLVDGGAGSDTVKGGPGDDTLIFTASEHSAGDVDTYYGDRGTLSNAKGDDGIDTLELYLDDADIIASLGLDAANIPLYKLEVQANIQEQLDEALETGEPVVLDAIIPGILSELTLYEVEEVDVVGAALI